MIYRLGRLPYNRSQLFHPSFFSSYFFISARLFEWWKSPFQFFCICFDSHSFVASVSLSLSLHQCSVCNHLSLIPRNTTDSTKGTIHAHHDCAAYWHLSFLINDMHSQATHYQRAVLPIQNLTAGQSIHQTAKSQNRIVFPVSR